MEHDSEKLVLPVSVVSPTDVARLSRELQSIDNFFQDAKLRQAGEPTAMPRLSKLLDQLVSVNSLSLLKDTDRMKLQTLLQSLAKSAPVLHISFSVDPPGPYVQKLVAWLRANIGGSVLVTVGLQPNIGAGCIVRSTNKIFDFSLREYFMQKREFFISKLHEAIADESYAPVADMAPPAGAPPLVVSVTPEVTVTVAPLQNGSAAAQSPISTQQIVEQSVGAASTAASPQPATAVVAEPVALQEPSPAAPVVQEQVPAAMPAQVYVESEPAS